VHTGRRSQPKHGIVIWGMMKVRGGALYLVGNNGRDIPALGTIIC